jgi:hypothetical protein
MLLRKKLPPSTQGWICFVIERSTKELPIKCQVTKLKAGEIAQSPGTAGRDWYQFFYPIGLSLGHYVIV